MLQRAICVVLGAAALLGVLWLRFTENYMGLFVIAGVCLVVIFALCTFLYIASAPKGSGVIEKAMQRRSARKAMKELLECISRR